MLLRTVVGAVVACGVLAALLLAAEEVPGLLFSESFEDTNLTSRGWYDGNAFPLSEKEFVAGRRSIEFHFPKGAIKPPNWSAIRHLFEPTEEIHLRFYLKLSPGWAWPGPYGPHFLHFMTTANGQYDGPAASHLTLYWEPAQGKARLAAQDIQNKDMPHGLTQGPLRGGYNGRFYDSKEVLFDNTEWHLIEAMYKLNSLDMANDRPNPDGELRCWVDGELVVERTDVVFRSTDFPQMKFNQFLMAPYFGPTFPHDQTFWVDELAVGTQPIGPLGKRPGDAPRQAEGEKSKALVIIAAGKPEPGTTRLEVDALSEATSKPGNTYLFTEALIEELNLLGVEAEVLSYTQCRDLASLLPLDLVVFAAPTYNGTLPKQIQALVPQVKGVATSGSRVVFSALTSAASQASGSQTVAAFVQQLRSAGASTVPGLALTPTAQGEEVQSKVSAFAQALVAELLK